MTVSAPKCAVPVPDSTVTHWSAPAKLNLFLHVTARRADGYHELQTLFQLIDLCDTITIALREDGRLERPVGPANIAPHEDLTLRAALALQQHTGSGRGAELRVHKRIPQGGGLGGGSSDAATTLLALNELWDCRMSVDELAGLALPLGADVPVFVRGSSAWAEGIGERLTPVALPEAWYVIIYPGVGVSTSEVFQSAELTRNSPLITIRALFQSGGRNDCEPVVRARSPEVAAALDWLTREGSARLTGTGSCVFTARSSAADAERLAARVPERWMSYVARGLNTSPVHEQLRQRGRRV
jgi:4-diphosphocytidyl-2-C-methyl-D-erythritol kinase